MGGTYPPICFHCPGDSGGTFKRRVHRNAALLDSPLLPDRSGLEFLGPDLGDWVTWESFLGPRSVPGWAWNAGKRTQGGSGQRALCPAPRQGAMAAASHPWAMPLALASEPGTTPTGANQRVYCKEEGHWRKECPKFKRESRDGNPCQEMLKRRGESDDK